MRNRVGTQPPSVGASTLWQEFERLSLSVDEFGRSQLDESAVNSIAMATADAAAKLTVTKEVLEGSVFKYLAPGFKLAQRFSTVPHLDTGNLLESRLVALEATRLGRSTSASTAPQVAFVLTTTDTAAHSRIDAVLVSMQTLEDALKGSQLKVHSLEAELKLQEAELVRTQAAMSTNQVTIDGLVFESALQVQSFVKTHRVKAMSLCCVDFMSFFQLASHDVSTHSQALSEEAAAIKAGYESHMQSVISIDQTLQRRTVRKAFVCNSTPLATAEKVMENVVLAANLSFGVKERLHFACGLSIFVSEVSCRPQ